MTLKLSLRVPVLLDRRRTMTLASESHFLDADGACPRCHGLRHNMRVGRQHEKKSPVNTGLYLVAPTGIEPATRAADDCDLSEKTP